MKVSQLIDDYVDQAKAGGINFDKDIDSEKKVQKYKAYLKFFKERDEPKGIQQRSEDFDMLMINAKKMIGLSRLQQGGDEFTQNLFNNFIDVYKHRQSKNYKELVLVLFAIIDIIREINKMEFETDK